MIEKLKPYENADVYVHPEYELKDGEELLGELKDGTRLVTIKKVLTPAELKINEIIDIVNATAQVVHDWPFTPKEAPKEAPKKRTAREIVEALIGTHTDYWWKAACEAIYDAFDRESIE